MPSIDSFRLKLAENNSYIVVVIKAKYAYSL